MAAELAELERDGRAGEPVYADLQHRFEVLGGYTLDQRVDAALSGLGFARGRVDPAAAALSGGEQTRAALARLVDRRPRPAHARRADEPPRSRRPRVARGAPPPARRRRCSWRRHDRAFLDATVTRVWELRDRRLTAFRGDYSRVPPPARGARRARRARTSRRRPTRSPASGSSSSATGASASTQDARARGPARAARGRPRRDAEGRHAGSGSPDALAGPARRARARSSCGLEDLVGRLPAGPRGARRRRLRAPPARRRRPHPVPRRPARRADRDRRAERRRQDDAPADDRRRPAAARRRPDVRRGRVVGYLAQLRGAAIPGATVLDALLEAMPITPGEARGYLARFLFRGDDAFKEVRTAVAAASGRASSSRCSGIMPSNLLLLDEPTNHLDIPAREAIEAFLRETPATIARGVSHDRRLLETVCDRLWVVDGGLAVPFDGGYRAWRAAVADGLDGRGGDRRRGAGCAPAGVQSRGRRSPVRPATVRARPAVDERPRRAMADPGAAPSTAAGAGPSRGPAGAPARPPEAVEGGLPAPEDGARGRAHPARPAQEPPRAGDGRPGRGGQLRRAAPDHERARRRVERRWQRPRSRGSSSRSGAP